MGPQEFPGGGGYPSSGYASSMPPGVASSFGGQSPSYPPFGGAGMPMSAQTQYPPPMAHSAPYHPPAAPPMAHSAPYHQPPYPLVVPHSSSHRGRSMSVSYAPTPYPGQPMSANGMFGGVPQQIVLSKSSHKKHKHRHHRSRSRSRDRGRRSRSHDRHRSRH